MKLTLYDREPGAPGDDERKLRHLLRSLEEEGEYFTYIESGDRLYIAVRHDDGEVFAWSARIESRAVAEAKART